MRPPHQAQAFVLALLLPLRLSAQAASIAPPENLVSEGLAPIPASVATLAGRYAEFRSARFLDWHPTRREMLIGTRFGDAAQVHRVKFPGGDRTQLTFFPDPVGNASYEPTRGEFMVFSKDVGGGEFYQYYRLDFSTGTITLLTDGHSRNTGMVWSRKGDRIAYGSTRRSGKDVDIWVMDPRDPSSDRMVQVSEGGGWSVEDWSPDDQTLLVQEGISANESYLWLLDVATGDRIALTPKTGEKVSYSNPRFAPDGKGIYLTTDRDSEFHRLAYTDALGRRMRYLTSQIHWDVDEFELSPDGRQIAFVANEDGVGVLHLLATATGKEHPVSGLPAGLLSGVRWRRNSRELGFTFQSPRAPADAYSLDIVNRRPQRWTESETGGLATKEFPAAELIRWRGFDGQMLSGFLYRPPARYPGKRPVIVNIHGGPEGQSRPGFLGRGNFYLDELGVALLYPNIRGSTGYGKSFLASDNGVRREGAYRDIGSLLDWIATRDDLDAARVMMTGGSYGGHMTLVSATRYDDRICCSVDVVGISNLATFLRNTSGYRQDLRRVEYGDERDSVAREFMERTAPLNNAAGITRPLFVVQGLNDPRVPPSEAEQMVATVRQNGGAVWYLAARDEGHGFQKKKNVDFQFYATVTFVRQFLLGDSSMVP